MKFFIRTINFSFYFFYGHVSRTKCKRHANITTHYYAALPYHSATSTSLITPLCHSTALFHYTTPQPHSSTTNTSLLHHHLHRLTPPPPSRGHLPLGFACFGVHLRQLFCPGQRVLAQSNNIPQHSGVVACVCVCVCV